MTPALDVGGCYLGSMFAARSSRRSCPQNGVRPPSHGMCAMVPYMLPFAVMTFLIKVLLLNDGTSPFKAWFDDLDEAKRG